MVFSMIILQFNLKIKHFSHALSLVSLNLSGGEVLSDVEISVNILLVTVQVPCVMQMTATATSTTAVQQTQSVVYCQLGMKRENALGFKVSPFFNVVFNEFGKEKSV